MDRVSKFPFQLANTKPTYVLTFASFPCNFPRMLDNIDCLFLRERTPAMFYLIHHGLSFWSHLCHTLCMTQRQNIQWLNYTKFKSRRHLICCSSSNTKSIRRIRYLNQNFIICHLEFHMFNQAWYHTLDSNVT